MTLRGKPIVLYSGPLYATDIARATLGGDFELRRVEPDPKRLLDMFSSCAAFLDASMKVPILAEDIERAHQLRLVVTATTGATHIDKQALSNRGIPLLTLKGQKDVLRNLTPAAELSWALVLACARKLRGAISHVENHRWERVEFPGLMLKDRMLGLIGMGRIGSWMARYADAFGMKVSYHDPFTQESPPFAESLPLEELVANADVISVHVHVTEDTRGMIEKSLVQCFKPGVVFINTARSELVDEVALVEALESGRIGAVGVDVLQGEPEIERSPLWQYARNHENVIITPHIGGYCPDAVNKVVAFSCQRIRDFFENG